MKPLQRSRRNARDVRRVQYAANVAEAIGPVAHGCEIYGLTRGQYSLIDIVEHILSYTGPADLVFSTWTAAGADIDYALRLCQDGRVRRVQWVVDSSFQIRQPGYCAAMRERFGDEAIRVTQNHAKFVLVGNADWAVVLRTSMNLNENKRLESFEVSEDPELYAYLSEVVAEMYAVDGAPTVDVGNSESRRQFDRATEAKRDPARRLHYI